MDQLEAQLSDRLFRLADRVSSPPADPAGDLRRGRRKLRRTRAVMVLAPAAVVAVIAGGVALAQPGGPAGTAPVAPVASSPTEATKAPRHTLAEACSSARSQRSESELRPEDRQDFRIAGCDDLLEALESRRPGSTRSKGELSVLVEGPLDADAWQVQLCRGEVLDEFPGKGARGAGPPKVPHPLICNAILLMAEGMIPTGVRYDEDELRELMR